MRSVKILAAILALHIVASATSIVPSTTLRAETSNNTSAADSWTASTNGNVGATNVSKVDHRTLLYPGSTTKIYTHMMHWFGPSNHVQVGYRSDNPAQVRKQVDDHVNRGIDGTIVDWYSTHHTVDNNATFELMRYAESLPGLPFKFAIMEDKGALLPCANTYGCDLTQALINDLFYVWNNFAQSPAYVRGNDSRPLVFFFGLEQFSIDWARVKANAPANLAFIFQNSGGFPNALSDGAFAWVQINPSDAYDWKQSYLGNFYYTANRWPTKHAVGAAWKGFDDRLASWSMNRVMAQQCGQVWLNTWNEVNRYYSATNQMEMMQLVTWNDYEEGTALEPGVESCVSINATVDTTGLISWTISGQENTIDHYTVFASLDGANLAPIADVAAGIRQYNLGPLHLDAGKYIFYVKAVGKPSLVNKMSNPVSWTSAGAPGVVISTPFNGATVKTPFRLAATAVANPGAAITATRLMVDGQEVFTANEAAIETQVSIAAGIRTLTVQAQDNTGAVSLSSITLTVVENKPPQASVAVTPATNAVAPVTVTISSAASTDADGTVVASTLKCGGMDHAGPVATHTFDTPGTYDITAVVTDNDGAKSTSTTTFTVAAAGIAVAQPANGVTVADPNVRFVASALAPTGRTISAMRIYVDAVDRFSVNAGSLDTVLTLSTGMHSVFVQAWDTAGVLYKTQLSVTVLASNVAPTVSVTATPASVATGAAVTATVHAADSDGAIASYRLDFGDGFVTTTASAAHAYAAAGTYTVRATVTDNRGAAATSTTSVTVAAPVMVPGGITVISPTPGTNVSTSVRFQATATAPTGRTITAMRVYVDGAPLFSTHTSKLDATLSLKTGSRNVVVQAWDDTGAVYKKSFTITVSATRSIKVASAIRPAIGPGTVLVGGTH